MRPHLPAPARAGPRAADGRGGVRTEELELAAIASDPKTISVPPMTRTESEVQLGLGRIVALHHRASTSYKIHEQIRCLCF